MKKVIENFEPLTGKHCITTSIRQILNFYNFKVTESMVFGLGSGLSWFYMQNKAAPFPIISGRILVGEFENNLAENLNIKVVYHKTSSSKRAYQTLKSYIEEDVPVMAYVDMAYLKYQNLPDNAHFGGHSIVIFGIDEENVIAYISDRDGENSPTGTQLTGHDIHLITLNELEKARGSNLSVFSAGNQLYIFDLTNIDKAITLENIKNSILKNADAMLNPPIANLGVKGIKKFAERINSWKDFDDQKLISACFNATFMINEKGGTGGGAFRIMYGEFLTESGEILKSNELISCGKRYYNVGLVWDEVSNILSSVCETLDRTKLLLASGKIEQIYNEEHDIFIILQKYFL